MKNKKRKILIIYYLIIAIVLVISYFFTYSNYVTSIGTESYIDVAKWEIKVNEDTNVTIDLEETLTSSLYVDSGDVDVTVVPGTSGLIELTLDFSQMNVATDYTITVNTGSSNLPDNLKLYTNSNYTVQFTSFSGTTELDTTTITRYIYWKWNYTTTDETEKWMGNQITLTLNINATQRID